MATLTSNISSFSLSVSGTTQQSKTISWTIPSVPSDTSINSCTLTGTATASMSKGSATITVNGTTVTSGTSFSINLGTSNTTSSVTATVVGKNKNASGTVNFTNLVYTVDYTSTTYYTVTFVDYDGTVLKTETVLEGGSATAPTSPSSKENYTFSGWDVSFSNVTSDLTVTAQYEVNKYTVTFVDYDGTVIKTETVEHGKSATAPSNPNRTGYIFSGWSDDFSNIISDVTITALYTALVLNVKENGNWVSIRKIFRKIAGEWVEQNYVECENLFDTNIKYLQKIIQIPTAILYSDGSLVFSSHDNIDSSRGDVVASYTGWDTQNYETSTVPWYDKRNDIVTVYYDAPDLKIKNTNDWFYGFANLTSIDLNKLDTSNVTNMTKMFNGCFTLKSINLSSFDTSNVTDMSQMFGVCESLTSINLSNFDTNNVTNMGNMFFSCSNLKSVDLSNFNTSNVANMYGIFNSCSNLISVDLSNFDTSNVTNMGNMFYKCSNLTSIDLSSFDTSNVTDMNNMFYYCSKLTSIDLSNFNTSNVTNMNNMFIGCSNLTLVNLSNFDMSNVTKMASMFRNCTNPNLTIYVKDEVTKTKIEASSNFPTTATVIIGKPA